jgi:hypothetical protein
VTERMTRAGGESRSNTLLPAMEMCICKQSFKSLQTRLWILTYSMEQSPSWEANRFVARQEIPRILLNLKVHYCIQNCLPPVSILSQPTPVYTPTSHFLKSHPNIILPSTPGSPSWWRGYEYQAYAEKLFHHHPHIPTF